MSKKNQIEKALQEIDASKFHKLIDSYLSKEYSYKITSNGTKTAEDKPTTGTPDSFVILENGKYIFIEYTTQKTKIKDKFLDDIEKCFDEEKTGVKVNNIEKLILSCNTDLTPDDIETLKSKCTEKNIDFLFLGISTISNDLTNKHSNITKDFLDISIDTRQILDYDDFIKNYNANNYSTSLDTSLLCREEEFKKLYSYIENLDITIISGSAGIGKTKLALEACKSFAKKNNFQFKAILNRGADILDDILAYFNDEDNSYLILIDDVNRIHTALDYIQGYYGDKFQTKKLKIVATVRDYAKDKILNNIPTGLYSDEFELKALKDDSIKLILKEEFNIINHSYVERIIDISSGNPRLAIMAASVVNKENTLDSIYDVTALYDEYFSKIKDDLKLFNNDELLLTIVIVSFFRVLDKTNEIQVELIETTFGISIDTLWKNIEELHHLEIFDLYENEVVKVSDQILSTYLFYKIVFVDKKIQINTFLEHFFPKYKTKFIDVLIPLLTTFDTQHIIAILKEPVDQLWHKYIEDEGTLYEVINSFWFLKQTEILIYFNKKIENIEYETFDINEINFVDRPNTNLLNDPILEKLSIFKNDSIQNIQMATELLLTYFEKKPSIIQPLLYVFTKEYGFKYDSYRYGYERENVVLNTIWAFCKDGKNELITKLFIQVCKDFLKIEFEENKSKGREIQISRFKLAETDELKKIREKIFNYLNSLYKINIYQKDILHLLSQYSYGRGFRHNVTEVEKWDSENILKFIHDNFNSDSYYESKVVQKYLDLLEKFEIEYNQEIRIKFNNHIYDLEKVMTTDKYEIRRKDNKTIDIVEAEKIKRKELFELIKNFKLSNWIQLFENFSEFYNKDKKRDNYKFYNNLSELFEILLETDEKLFIQVLEEYLKIGNPYNLRLNFTSLINILNKDNSYKLLEKYSYENKDYWLFCFFIFLPKELTSKNDIEKIINFYKTVDKNSIPYNLDYLEKYLEFEPNIFIQVTKILTERTKNEDENFILNIEMIYEQNSKIFKNLEVYFKNDLEQLKTFYLVCMQTNKHFDYECYGLSKLIDIDKSFLERYIDTLFKNKDYLSSRDIWNNFSQLWLRVDYEDIFFKLIETIFLKTKENWRKGESLESFLNYQQEEEIDVKIDLLIQKYIDLFNKDEKRIKFLFDFISELSYEKREKFISYFLKKNSSFEIFKKLSFDPMVKSWSGSRVPYLQKEKDYYNSLLQYLNGIKFLEHKQFIENEIKYIEKDIKREKKSDFMDDY
ncbi:hypothetical protein [Arcobacter sp. YIC-310]|uniref:hypothetical protein n=1 Tax=Arcobacter sp. YIC-310 TaxID=3376632 RepID=UPI003C1C54FC